MKKSTRILASALLVAALVPACNKEAVQLAYDKQEANIASFVEAQLKADNLWLRENSLNNKSGRTYSLKIPDEKALFYNPKETKVHDRRWVINR